MRPLSPSAVVSASSLWKLQAELVPIRLVDQLSVFHTTGLTGTPVKFVVGASLIILYSFKWGIGCRMK